MILSDGIIGQVMEKVEVGEHKPRWTDEYIAKTYPWAATGKPKTRGHNVVTSLHLQSTEQEKLNIRLQAKYKECEANEVRYETFQCEDAEYVLVAYGSSARICQKVLELARAQGIKVGLIRPITLWPFPSKIIHEIGSKAKGILSVEMSAGQMIEDVKLAVECKVPVKHYGRFGGIIPTPGEILEALKNF
jgi:2-oxoglutarate ferredoxin oxidoreductase subunit alpha